MLSYRRKKINEAGHEGELISLLDKVLNFVSSYLQMDKWYPSIKQYAPSILLLIVRANPNIHILFYFILEMWSLCVVPADLEFTV